MPMQYDSDLPPVLFPEVNSIERERLFFHVERICEKWSDQLENLDGLGEVESEEE